MSKLLETLSRSTFFSDIKELIFNSNNNINIESSFSYICNIPSLSFANCDLDAAETLILFADQKDCTVHMLDLSQNSFSDQGDAFKLPSSLSMLKLNGITFPDQTLSVLISKFLLQKSSDLTTNALYLNNAKCSDWSNVLKQLRNEKPSKLSVLSWDSNRINKDFFSFLSKATNMKDLSLNYCIEESDDVFSVTDYFRKQPKITRLSIRGGQNQPENSLTEILNGINSLPSLQELDISEWQMTGKTFDAIQKMLVKHRGLLKISIDDCKVTDKGTWQEFVRKLQHRPRPTCLVVPDNTFSQMMKSNSISEEELSELISRIKGLSRIKSNDADESLSSMTTEDSSSSTSEDAAERPKDEPVSSDEEPHPQPHENISSNAHFSESESTVIPSVIMSPSAKKSLVKIQPPSDPVPASPKTRSRRQEESDSSGSDSEKEKKKPKSGSKPFSFSSMTNFGGESSSGSDEGAFKAKRNAKDFKLDDSSDSDEDITNQFVRKVTNKVSLVDEVYDSDSTKVTKKKTTQKDISESSDSEEVGRRKRKEIPKKEEKTETSVSKSDSSDSDSSSSTQRERKEREERERKEREEQERKEREEKERKEREERERKEREERERKEKEERERKEKEERERKEKEENTSTESSSDKRLSDKERIAMEEKERNEKDSVGSDYSSDESSSHSEKLKKEREERERKEREERERKEREERERKEREERERKEKEEKERKEKERKEKEEKERKEKERLEKEAKSRNSDKTESSSDYSSDESSSHSEKLKKEREEKERKEREEKERKEREEKERKEREEKERKEREEQERKEREEQERMEREEKERKKKEKKEKRRREKEEKEKAEREEKERLEREQKEREEKEKAEKEEKERKEREEKERLEREEQERKEREKKEKDERAKEERKLRQANEASIAAQAALLAKKGKKEKKKEPPIREYEEDDDEEKEIPTVSQKIYDSSDEESIKDVMEQLIKKENSKANKNSSLNAAHEIERKRIEEEERRQKEEEERKKKEEEEKRRKEEEEKRKKEEKRKRKEKKEKEKREKEEKEKQEKEQIEREKEEKQQKEQKEQKEQSSNSHSDNQQMSVAQPQSVSPVSSRPTNLTEMSSTLINENLASISSVSRMSLRFGRRTSLVTTSPKRLSPARMTRPKREDESVRPSIIIDQSDASEIMSPLSRTIPSDDSVSVAYRNSPLPSKIVLPVPKEYTPKKFHKPKFNPVDPKAPEHSENVIPPIEELEKPLFEEHKTVKINLEPKDRKPIVKLNKCDWSFDMQIPKAPSVKDRVEELTKKYSIRPLASKLAHQKKK